MKKYLKILSILYLAGGILHLLDIFDLRLNFSEMNLTWKIWTVCLLVVDLLAALGLWLKKDWGAALFIFVASSQLIAYSGLFEETFGNQNTLVLFHISTLIIFVFFKLKFNRSDPSTSLK